jgi:YidC/Oxa1 family membrane protein insertase
VEPIPANIIGDAFSAIEHALGSILAGIYTVVPNYGLAIVLLTVMIRLVLAPITAKGTRSMQKMSKLQPEIKKLQTKYKGDRERLNTELMALYKANKVNPALGCLPLLVQMPFLLAMFRVIGGAGAKVGELNTSYLPVGSQLYEAVKSSTLDDPAGAAQFLGLNLGVSPVQAVQNGIGIWPITLSALLVLAIVVTGWLQQRQMQRRHPSSTASQPQAMQTMTRVFPVVFGVISVNLPAGVNLYFLTSNLFQMAQQWWILRTQGDDEIVVPKPDKSATKRLPTSPKPAKAPKPTGGKPAPKSGTRKASSVVATPQRRREGAKATSDGVAPRPGPKPGKRVPTKVAPKSKRNRAV